MEGEIGTPVIGAAGAEIGIIDIVFEVGGGGPVASPHASGSDVAGVAGEEIVFLLIEIIAEQFALDGEGFGFIATVFDVDGLRIFKSLPVFVLAGEGERVVARFEHGIGAVEGIIGTVFFKEIELMTDKVARELEGLVCVDGDGEGHALIKSAGFHGELGDGRRKAAGAGGLGVGDEEHV